MDRYTIYCTEEQTRKALALGAPIDYSSDNFDSDCTDNIGRLSNGLYAIIPTAEQMIGWLEEQEEISDLHIFKPAIRWTFELYTSNGGGKNNHPLFNTRKEATLASIDVALDYLKETTKE